MSNYNWCHGPKCHKHHTQDRIRGVKGSYKNAVKSAAEELFKRSTDYTDDEANEIEARRKLESQGVDWLVDFSASDQRAFLDAAAETWKEAANDAGGDALNNRARILKAIGR